MMISAVRCQGFKGYARAVVAAAESSAWIFYVSNFRRPYVKWCKHPQYVFQERYVSSISRNSRALFCRASGSKRKKSVASRRFENSSAPLPKTNPLYCAIGFRFSTVICCVVIVRFERFPRFRHLSVYLVFTCSA